MDEIDPLAIICLILVILLGYAALTAGSLMLAAALVEQINFAF